MLIYALKRIALIIPTMCLVMVIAFFLSKAAPGDQALSLLHLQGISIENPSVEKEYERNYLRLHLDKPNFYWSVVPDFYPDNINGIVSSTKRQRTIALLAQKVQYDDAIAFEAALDKWLIDAEQINQDTSEYAIAVGNIAGQLRYQSDIPQINILLDQLQSLPDVRNFPTFLLVREQFARITSHRQTLYFPKLRWNGSQCQFHIWAIKAIKGDLGISIKDGRSVMTKITPALQWTILLLVLNLIFSSLISIGSGVLSAYHVGGLFDRLSSVVWLVLYAIPVFWLASMLILYFTSDRYGQWMNIFPAPGTWMIDPNKGFLAQIVMYSGQLILPIICLVANDIAFLSRLTRNNIVEQKSKLYATMALAKGLSPIQVMKSHVVPNAMIPIITIIAGSIPSGLSGSLLVEVIFNIPGMGRLMYESIFSTDWNVVFGILIIVSLSTMVFLLIADLLYAWLHPKVKLQ
jgi:peptide/nickel transport system permease protein